MGSGAGGDGVMKVIRFLLILLLFAACTKQEMKTQPAFYYWKTTYSHSPFLSQFLNDLNIKKLYLRFFDVDWNNEQREAMPVGELHFNSAPDTALAIVPVVYITNKTFEKITDPQTEQLAQHIYNKVQTMAGDQHISFSELQLDCDWTEGTRENYFQLIRLLKQRLHAAEKRISVTVRLHQVKYPSRTGIPEADQGMLMFYNMGQLQSRQHRNSIYNEQDAGKYTAFIQKYPLHLDVVLPCFSWAVHLRDNKIIGLLNKVSEHDFNLINFTSTGENTYSVNAPLFFRGEYLMKNDLLKLEQVTPQLLVKAAKQLASHMKVEERTVAIFDLDSINVVRYEKENFEEAYNCFH